MTKSFTLKVVTNLLNQVISLASYLIFVLGKQSSDQFGFRLTFVFLFSFCATITIVLCATQSLSESVCKTKSCEKEAAQMLSKIDDSVEICENFFDFSCGNYKPEIPSHKTKIDELDLILDKLQENLNLTMGSKINANEIEPFKKLKTFYQNCMDESLSRIFLFRQTHKYHLFQKRSNNLH
jgi:Peptidase family M13